MALPRDPMEKVFDEAMDTKARELLRTEPYLQRLSREDPTRAYKESYRFAAEIVSEALKDNSAVRQLSRTDPDGAYRQLMLRVSAMTSKRIPAI